jgi:hypothetical protein
MRTGFAIKKCRPDLDLESLSAGITAMINVLGLQGRIQTKELDDTIEFIFDTKDVFDYDDDNVRKPYVTK